MHEQFFRESTVMKPHMSCTCNHNGIQFIPLSVHSIHMCIFISHAYKHTGNSLHTDKRPHSPWPLPNTHTYTHTITFYTRSRHFLQSSVHTGWAANHEPVIGGYRSWKWLCIGPRGWRNREWSVGGKNGSAAE